MAKLIHSQANKILGEYTLEPGRISIGRSPDNNICLDDLTVSGKHALISIKPSEYIDDVNDVVIEDLQSTNGTVIDGKHIKRYLMKHGDVAHIGQHEFAYIDEDALRFEQTMVFIPPEE